MRERTGHIFFLSAHKSSPSLLEIVDGDKLQVPRLELVGQPVLEAVNVPDGLQDDVELGHVVLGGDARNQLLQSAIKNTSGLSLVIDVR